jgi:polyphosphate kinase 2 (PPK2 family)
MENEMRKLIDQVKNFEKSLNEDVKNEEKYFLVTDKSGRSAKPYKLNRSYIEKTWDLGEEDWDGEQTLGHFLEDCYIADTWDTRTEKVQCVAIK